MNIKERAEIFAIIAHDGQVRKADPNKPYIIHPIDVANKLKAYGFGDDVVAAGILHDVVEDTPITLTEIQNLFGNHIASLVKGSSEQSKIEKTNQNSQKEASWEERKQETINRVKNLDFEHKAVACVDKISNLEDILILSGKIGEPNFSSFKRGMEQQKWYYENLYQNLIYGCDENSPMFQDLKKLIDLLFRTPFSKEYSATLSYRMKELVKLRSIYHTKDSNLSRLYFKNPEIATYNKIKEYFNSIDVETYSIPSKYSIVGEYPQITYNWDEKNLSIWIEFYYETKKHNDMINPELKNNPSQQIVDTIMNDLYDQSLNTVKRKIKEKKRMSLD